MSVTKELKLGDPCPNACGPLVKAVQPTDAERAKAAAKHDDWVPLPPHYDTAPAEVVAEYGELYRCPQCGYPHRFKPEAAHAKKAKGKGAADGDE